MQELMQHIVEWAVPASLSALAAVGWTIGQRVLNKLDHLEQTLFREVGNIKERLARIEGHIWPASRSDSRE